MLNETKNKNVLVLGIVLSIVLGIVLLICIFNKFKKNVIKEGLDNMNSTSVMDKPKAIENNTQDLEDRLLISKYKTSYEDIIIELEKNIELNILKSIFDNSEYLSKDPTSKSNINLIDNINKLNLFLENLNKNILILDKH